MGVFLLRRLSESLSLFSYHLLFLPGSIVLVLFLSCCFLRVISQSLVALQCNMLRCFEDNFQVFPCPWFGKSTNPPIVTTLAAVCYCSTPAAATKYCGHNHEKAAFFLSLAHYSPANALVLPMLTFPFKYSNILKYCNRRCRAFPSFLKTPVL